jgi:Tol biopolymer transport system component
MNYFKRAGGILIMLAVVAAGSLSAGEPVKLTHDGRLKRDPRFVAGGSQVVFSTVESPILMRLVRLDLGSGKIEPLYPQAATSQFEPSFSSDQRYHVFVEFRGVTNVKLVIRDTRDNRDVIFDPGSDRAHLGNPAVDPRGQQIVFSLPRTVGQQLVSIDLQGQNRRNLTPPSDAIDDWAAFSPDGRQIAFGSSRDGDFEIYVMNADGSQPRRLTESPGIDMRPAWSSDGRQLAFTSLRDGNYEIYTINADGSGLRRMTNHPERDDFAQWHPDGRHLLTISERDGEFDLYLWDMAQESP